MQGSEKDKRRLMSYVINEEAKNSYINLDLLRKNFDSIDIDALQTIMKSHQESRKEAEA